MRLFLKSLAVVLGLLLLLVAGASYWLAQRIDRELPAQLKASLNGTTYGLYELRIRKVQTFPLGRRIILKDVDVHINPEKLRALQRVDSVPERLGHLQIRRIELSGIAWEDLLRHRIARVADIAVSDVRVDVENNTGHIPLQLRPARSRMNLARVDIGHFVASGLQLRIHHRSATHPVEVSSTQGSIRAENVAWQSGILLPSYSDFQVAFGATVVHLPASRRSLEAEGWQLDGLQWMLRLTGFQFIQPMQPWERGVQHQLKIPLAEISGLKRRFEENEILFSLGKVRLYRPQVTAQLTASRRDTVLLKTRKFPIALLESLNLPLRVDTLQLQRGSVSYTEDGFRTRLPAELLFDELTGRLYNVWFYASETPHPPLDIHLQGHFQHQTLVKLNAQLHHDSLQHFRIRGSMHSLDGNQIRTLARHLGLIQMDKLEMDEAQFDLSGSLHDVTTRAAIKYRDLKIQLLQYDSANQTLRRKPMASLLANQLLLYPENPLPGQPLRTAVSTLPRPENRTFFTAVWRGMFDAITQTVVSDPDLIDYVKQREKRRQERLKNRLHLREERLRRRQERRSGETIF